MSYTALRHSLTSALILLMLATLSGSAAVTATPTYQTTTPPQQPQQPTPTRPILLTDHVPDPKQQGVLYFPAIGHTLRGAFLEYWNRYGGLAQFGYPLTEEFFEEVGSDHKQYQVQYFERNRFELHPENAGTPYEVLLGLLGRQLSEKKGYPYGWYPLFGHAVDYSWISGVVELYNPSTNCESADCGCVFLRHATRGGRNDVYKQLVSPTRISSEGRYQPATLPGDPFSISGSYFVVFGRQLLPTEKYSVCAEHATTPPPAYMRITAQINPGK